MLQSVSPPQSKTVPALGAIDGLSNAERKQRTADLLALARLAPTPAERERILDDAIVLNIPVARSLAARYRNRGQSLDDLEQVACLGLTKAVRAFDPDRGQDLLVFAVPSILGELKRHFRDATWTVRPPRRLQELRPLVREARERLLQELDRSPTVREIAEEVGHEVDEVAEAIGCDDCRRPAQLDEPAPGGSSVGSLLGGVDEAFERAEAVAVLAPACRQLKQRDRDIVRMRFFEQRTQSEIAEALGLSQVQVSRLLTRIMRDLRRAIDGAAA